MNAVTLRRAEPADATTVQWLLEEQARHHDETLEAGVEALLTWGFGPHALFRIILAQREADPMGFALYYPDFSTLRGRPGVMLQDLYVRPEGRGSGLGRALLAKVMADAQDWQAAFLTLMLDRANDQARAFYGRQGFVARGDYDLLILEGQGLATLMST